MSRQAIRNDSGIGTPSGKGARDENFPVASRLIAPTLRPHVLRFYAFARAADDIADNPHLDPGDKVARLDAMEDGLTGHGPQTAQALGQSLAGAGVTDRYARDLLAAFRQDAVKSRYADWADLQDYCALSANPVGRFMMDLHGEDRALWPASDALCTALQLLNHLQDCREDYRRMDRVYLPMDLFQAQGLSVEVLDRTCAGPDLRSVLDALLDRCDGLLAAARARPVRPLSRRLAAEMGVITHLAVRLSTRLRRQDPLAKRVALSRSDIAGAALVGVWSLVRPGRS